VIGSTDPEGVVKQPSDPVEIPDFSATVLAALGIDGGREVTTSIGRPMKLSPGTPIARLLRGEV
jgi:glutamate mutase epsilon subunit